MKKILRRVIALVVVFVISFSSIYVLNTVAADEPKISVKCETVINADVKEGGFGESITSLRNSTIVTLPSAINLSNSDLFEFDVYIEDIDALKKAFENSFKVNFNFSSNKRSIVATANNASADISEQLVSNGWNHIEIKRDSFVENNIDWSAVRHYYLGLSDESVTLFDELYNKPIKIKNLCESYDTPVLSDGDIILFDNAIFGTLGKNVSSSLSSISKTFSTETNLSDISNASILKLDLLIPDLESFKSFVQNKTLKFILYSNSGKAECIFDGAYFGSTIAKWYIIQLPLSNFIADSNFDFEKVTDFKIEIESDNESTVGSIYNMTFAFANIRAIEFIGFKGDEVLGNEVENYNISNKIVGFGETFADFTANVNSDFSALADAENIEFDLYVNNLDGFKNFFAFDRENNSIDASLDLVLSQDVKTIEWSNIEDLVLAKGWNHIILPIEDAKIIGFDVTKDFENLKIEVGGVDKNINSANFGEFIIIDNVVSTKSVAAKGELNYEKIATVSNGKTCKIGNSFAAISKKLDTPIDISNAKMVEFDIYIQNFETFRTLMGEKGISNISFRLSSTSGDDYSQDSATIEILEQISKNGWNHLSISIYDFNDGIIGNFDITKVNGLELVFNGNSAANTDLLASQIISVKNITVTDIKDPDLPENADPVISEDGKSGVYGETYNDISNGSLVSLSSPVDVTKYGALQFDFFVSDYNKFKKLLAGSSNSLKFAIGTSKNNDNNRAVYEFVDQVVGQGWNRITLDRFDYEKYGNDDNPDFKTVYYAFLTFGNDNTANEYKNFKFKIRNICSVPSEYDIAPKLSENYVVDIWKEGLCSTWGINYVDAKKIFSADITDNPIDITDIDFIEFDIYIKDYESFMEAAEIGSLRFIASSNGDDMNQNILMYNFIDQVTHDGWNHIKIKQSSYIYNWNTDFAGIKWVYLTMWSSSVQTSPNPLSNTVLRIVNVVGTHGEYRSTPALPDNVVSILGDENGAFVEGNTVGQQYHFTLDRIYKEKFQPIDFSKTNKIEFDIYIDDYEKFLAAENDPNDYRNSKLAFEVSSTIPALWGQYNAPRHYFSSAINIAPYITHSGWNHVVVGKQEFTPVNNGGVDWSAITAFLCFYRGSSNVYPVNNPYADLYVRVANIVNTGVVAMVDKNQDQPLQNDKSAVYINSAEGIVDNIGAWNTMSGYISTDFKTEGKASILQSVDYTKTIDDTNMAFIFDTTADLSDIKTLKFDYFIDIPQFLNKNSNTIQVILGNDRFINDNYFYWELSPDNFKEGWNEISLEFSNVKTVGKPDLDAIKIVALRFTELSLDVESFAVVVNGIDNLRYISTTGNKILKVEGLYENEENNETIYEDGLFDTDFDMSIENDEEIENTVNKNNGVKYNKILEKRIVTDYTIIIIFLAIEAAIVVVGLIVFTIVFEIKRKKSN